MYVYRAKYPPMTSSNIIFIPLAFENKRIRNTIPIFTNVNHQNVQVQTMHTEEVHVELNILYDDGING